MSAIWTWTQAAWQGSGGDGEGWFKQDSLLIDAPKSIQRLIFRASAGGQATVVGGDGGDGRGLPAGYVELTWSLQSQDEIHVVWQDRAYVQISGVYNVVNLVPQFSASFTLDHQLAGDMQLRRAAPPPPEPGLILGFYWHYHPIPFQDPSETQYPKWDYSMSVWMLTSEPGVTA